MAGRGTDIVLEEKNIQSDPDKWIDQNKKVKDAGGSCNWN